VQVRDCRWIFGSTIKDTLWEVEPRLALTETDRCRETTWEVAVTLAELLPAGTVTEPGMLTAELLLDRFNTVPPANAGADKATVQDVEEPPTITKGLQVSEVRVTVGACRVIVVMRDTPPSEAVSVAWLLLEIVPAVTINVAVDCALGIVIETGTVSDELELARLTLVATATLADNWTVHVLEADEVSEVGLQVSDVTVAGGGVAPPNGVAMSVTICA
jgi:hypothetical protein